MRCSITVLVALVLTSCLVPSAAAINFADMPEPTRDDLVLTLGFGDARYFEALRYNGELSLSLTNESDLCYWLWVNNDGDISIKGPWLRGFEVGIKIHPLGQVYMMTARSDISMHDLKPDDFRLTKVFDGAAWYRYFVRRLEAGEDPVAIVRINRSADQIETWRRHEFAINTQMSLSLALNVDLSQVRVEYVENNADEFDMILLLPAEYQGLPVVQKWSADIGRYATGKLDLGPWKMRSVFDTAQ